MISERKHKLTVSMTQSHGQTKIEPVCQTDCYLLEQNMLKVFNTRVFMYFFSFENLRPAPN